MKESHVIKLLHQHPEGLSIPMMAEHFGKHPDAIRYHVKHLREKGQLEKFMKLKDQIVRYRLMV